MRVIIGKWKSMVGTSDANTRSTDIEDKYRGYKEQKITCEERYSECP